MRPKSQKSYSPTTRFINKLVKTEESIQDKFILKEPFNDKPSNYCNIIHIGIVCSGYKNTVFFHNLLKSIFFHRVNPIYLHIITDKNTEYLLNTLLVTWDLPQVNFIFYDLSNFVHEVKWVPNSHYSGVYGMLKILFPKLVPYNVKKMLVFDTDLTVNSDINELWKLFKNFNNKQAIGMVENESDFYLNGDVWPAIGKGYNSGVLMYHLERLRKIGWNKLWPEVTKKAASGHGTARLADQDVINAVLKERPELLYEIVHWNSPKKLNVVNPDREYFKSLADTYMEYNGNLLRKQLLNCDNQTKSILIESQSTCDKFRRASETKWRTLLYFMPYDYKTLEYDVTLVAQCSFDRLVVFEEIANYWPGPMSITFYLSDAELIRASDFILHSEILMKRKNIAYHVVFKDGDFYPINILRNTGLSNVDTPFVFLTDIDFIPVSKLYSAIKDYLKETKKLINEALIIPAFELSYFADSIPRNKSKLIELWEKGRVNPFLEKIWPSGHSPTNFPAWQNAEEPYNVKWDHDFEPYIVVRSNVTQYDKRFVGFGWNKVSHIMELEAQGYTFTVLPNVFIVHKPHSPSSDMISFRTSPQYRLCLHFLKDEVIQSLNKRYGKNFELKNVTITFPPMKRRKRNYDYIQTTAETNTDYPYVV
ncbi:unnamed protein product [Brassicogethes aeneus]|uniref:Uncharacterized protein n=1 Tax=Brassicogethes aeneus TaxID=1431903 RepID=A0A9P0BCP4_BRAAE|nr:unnamed protein product [Brassicogethes aeneus]